MKHLIVFIATFLISIPAFCEEFTWEEVETPQGGELKIIVLDSNGTYWGVTGTNDFYYRMFGAYTWLEKEISPTIINIMDGFVTSNNDICFYSSTEMLISTDGGNSWTVKELPGEIDEINSNIHSVLYSETFCVLYRSTDLGDSWAHVYGQESFVIYNRAANLSVTPHGDYVDFISNGSTHSYMKSTDDGVNWMDITDSLIGICSLKGIFETKYHTDGYMVVGTNSKDSNDRYTLTLLSSIPGTDSWEQIAESKLDSNSSGSFSIISSYFLHSDKMIKWNKASAFNDLTVFDDSFTIEEYYLSIFDDDIVLEEGYDSVGIDTKGIKGIKFYGFDTGIGETLYGKSSEGLFRLNPEDDSWEKLSPPDDSYSYAYLGASSDDDYLVYCEDNNTIYRIEGQEWIVINDNIADSKIVPSFNNDILIYSTSGGHYISKDFGKTSSEMSSDDFWSNDYGKVELKEYLLGSGDVHYRSTVLYKKKGENKFAAANTFLLRTTDNGKNWEEILNINEKYDRDTSKYESIASIYASLSPSGLLYYSIYGKLGNAPMQVSNDNGDTFTDCMHGINGDEYFYGNMFFSPKYNHTLLLTDKNLYLSKDSYTWELITPDIEYNVSNACFTSDGIIYVLDSYGNVFKSTNPVSVEENIYAKSPQIYPNPADNALYINLGTEYSGTAKVKLISITGITVMEKGYTHSQQPIMLDVSGIQTGVYILSVSNDGELFNRKVIIE